MQHHAVRKAPLILRDRPDGIVAIQRHVRCKEDAHDAGSGLSGGRIDSLESCGRLLGSDEPAVQRASGRGRVVRVLGLARCVPLACRVRQRLANDAHAARLGGEGTLWPACVRRACNRGRARRLLGLNARVARVRVPLHADRCWLGLDDPAPCRRALAGFDERRRRAACRGEPLEVDRGADEEFEESARDERGAVLGLAAGCARCNAQLVKRRTARLVDRGGAPLLALEDGRCLGSEDGGGREAAVRKGGVHHRPLAIGDGEAHAQPGGHNGDIVLPPARLLERTHELERL